MFLFIIVILLIENGYLILFLKKYWIINNYLLFNNRMIFYKK